MIEKELPYSEEIMEAVRQNLGLEEDDTSMDDRIVKMSRGEVLNRVATWNNLIGYGDTIRNWVENIYGVLLEG